MTRRLRPARLRPSDIVRLGGTGLRTRPLRVFLSALGIAIGVAAMTAVIGISASGQAEVDRRLDKLGTNLLRAAPAEQDDGTRARLPKEAVAMVKRIGSVLSAGQTAVIEDAKVYRNEHIPSGRTGSIDVTATGRGLLPVIGGHIQAGSWLTPATEKFPGVVLGSTAAKRLGVDTPGTRLRIGQTWFSLVGVLRPVPLAPEIDSSALVGWPAAENHLAFDSHPTTVYLRAQDRQVTAVRDVLAATVSPGHVGDVAISRPSDALAVREATESTLTGLLLGLGGVALLVGGVGVGNTMVISVLERRGEIGLRCALGATSGHIRGQFLTEALLLSALGGLGGTLLGTAITASFAAFRGWPTTVPLWAPVAGITATLLIGAIAGLYPAIRAGRMAPAQALAGP
ncbi:ABC transporter permease [Streptomyces sp. R11]|uniref:ABC transporter permease n=1 Tax=Streptomyces sp. R11 TaxID=3238625 RepID=A0AB39NE87_9ACTN